MKQEDVKVKIVPKYGELSVIIMWAFVQKNNELMKYIPDYSKNQLPDWSFLFNIVSTFYPNELQFLINQARDKRALTQDSESDDIIEIDPDIKAAIMNVLTSKSK